MVSHRFAMQTIVYPRENRMDILPDRFVLNLLLPSKRVIIMSLKLDQVAVDQQNRLSAR